MESIRLANESPVARYARGRRPFLCKRTDQNNEQGEEDRQPNGDSWESKAKAVYDWLRNNPLNLGMEDEAVRIIKSNLHKVADPKTAIEKKKKCWMHVCIELEDVPGNPIPNFQHTSSKKEKVDVEPATVEPATLESASLEAAANNTDSSRVEESGPATSALKNNHRDVDFDEAQPEAFVQESCEAKSCESKLKVGAPEELEFDETPSQEEEKISTPQEIPKTVQTNESASITELRQSLPERISSPFQNAANSVVAPLQRKSLTSMTMLERQQHCLDRKKERAEKHRALREEKEIEECTYKPSFFTRRTSFSNVESVIKKERSRKIRQEQQLIRRKSESEKNQVGRPSFLEECKSLMNSSRNPATPQQTPDATPPLSKQPIPERRKRASNKKRMSKFKPIEKREIPISSDLLNSCKSVLDSSRASTPASEASAEPKDDILNDEVASSVPPQSPKPVEPAAEEENQLENTSKKMYRFAENSTASKGKISFQDHNEFQLDSFYRKRDRGSAKPGVSLLMGRREDDFTEQVVAVVFDRTKFTEELASEWMYKNAHRFPVGRRELIKNLRG